MPNITCPHCKFRHPANVSCEQAKRQAQLNAMKRAKAQREEAAAQWRWVVDDYNAAVLSVDERLGPGAADAILNLITRWNDLGEANARQD
jgi:hypothetical protein